MRMNQITPLIVIIKKIEIIEIIKFFVLTTLCALVTAVTLTYFYNETFQYFIGRWPEYTLVYTCFSLSMMLSFSWFKVVLKKNLNAFTIFYIASLSYMITFIICALVFSWFTIKQLGEGSLYLLNFMTSSAWVLLLMFYFNNKVVEPKIIKMNSIISNTQLQKDLAESQIQLLQAQLEPHFFFNTLANLHNLIEDSPDKAMYLLEELTQYLRLSLPQFRSSTQALSAEIDIIKRYLAIQNIRFDNQLVTEFLIEDFLLSAQILPMTVLTLVENAIKHGLEGKQNGVIKISVTLENELLTIRVADNAGKKSDKAPGIGLDNLKNRLMLRYGTIASVRLNQIEHQYTEAEMRIPYHGKSDHC